jgi:hypothetical protein
MAEPPGTRFGPGVRLCGVLMPWAAVCGLPDEFCSLYDRVWAPWAARGAVEAVPVPAVTWFDCGTPARYLAANLWASGGRTVVGRDAVVEGEAVDSVLWDGARVERGERIVRAIRTTAGRTVLVR